jgi:hypothetical protein
MSEQKTIPGFEDTQSPLGKQAAICYAESKKLDVQQSKCDSQDSELMAMLKKTSKKEVKIKANDGMTVTLRYKKTHSKVTERILIKEVEDID